MATGSTTHDMSGYRTTPRSEYGQNEGIDRLLLGRLRQELLAGASGKTLDLACGTGLNFRYLPENCQIVGADIDPARLGYARGTVRRLGRPITLEVMDAEHMTFPDNAFDTVVSSLALCSFNDPIRALHEMSRVCTPGGSILLLEHGRSSFRPWAMWQDYQERQRGPHIGCHHNREPLDLLKQAGLHTRFSRRTWFGIIHLIRARPIASEYTTS